MNNREYFQQKKIAVVGVGGVGGYLASLLASAYPHVSVVARGEKRKILEKEGLRLHSDFKGEIQARPETIVESAGELPVQDYVFLAVKNYSLEQACLEMLPAVDEHTVIIPVMNGADPGDRVRQALGKGHVVDAVIYIVSFLNQDSSVTQQGNFANMRIGTAHPEEDKMILSDLSGLLTGASLDHKVSENIAVDIWKKYILNCAYNVATAYYDNTIGELRSDPVKAAEYEALIREAYCVAAAKGIPVPDSEPEAIIDRFYHELEEGATSSLQRDFQAKRLSELETFSGYLVREADKLNLDVPVSIRMYEGLKAKENTLS